MILRSVSAALIGTLVLSACDFAPAPDAKRLSIVTRGTEPIYLYRGDGAIVPSACLTRGGSTYGNSPSACAVDSALGQQVAHSNDLVHPRHPGPPRAAGPARAAYEYIYGELPSDGQGEQPQPGILIPVNPAATNPDADETDADTAE